MPHQMEPYLKDPIVNIFGEKKSIPRSDKCKDSYILIGGIYVDNNYKQYRVTIWYDLTTSTFVTSGLISNLSFDFSQTYVSVKSFYSLLEQTYTIEFERFDLVYKLEIPSLQKFDNQKDITRLMFDIDKLNERYSTSLNNLILKTHQIVSQLEDLNLILEVIIQCNNGSFKIFPHLIPIFADLNNSMFNKISFRKHNVITLDYSIELTSEAWPYNALMRALRVR
jgi:hypothetical protein